MQDNDNDDNDERALIGECGMVLVAFLAFVALLGMACLWSGCSTTRYVPVESVIMRTDTCYSAKVRVDSVIFRDSVAVVQKGDTVFMTKYHDRFRYSERVDTVYRAGVDSVRVEVPYPVERELTAWERTKMDFGGMALGGLGVVIVAFAVWLAMRKRRI